MLQTELFHLYDMLEKAQLLRQKTDQLLPNSGIGEMG